MWGGILLSCTFFEVTFYVSNNNPNKIFCDKILSYHVETYGVKEQGHWCFTPRQQLRIYIAAKQPVPVNRWHMHRNDSMLETRSGPQRANPHCIADGVVGIPQKHSSPDKLFLPLRFTKFYISLQLEMFPKACFEGCALPHQELTEHINMLTRIIKAVSNDNYDRFDMGTPPTWKEESRHLRASFHTKNIKPMTSNKAWLLHS